MDKPLYKHLNKVVISQKALCSSYVARRLGEDVVVFSSNAQDKNYVGTVAKQLDTIPHELLVHIAESVKRLIVA